MHLGRWLRRFLAIALTSCGGMVFAQVPHEQIDVGTVLTSQGVAFGTFTKPLPLPPGDWAVVSKRLDPVTLDNGNKVARAWLTLRNRNVANEALAALVVSFFTDSARINWSNRKCGEGMSSTLVEDYGLTSGSFQYLCGFAITSNVRKIVSETATTTNSWRKNNLTPLTEFEASMPAKGLWINLYGNLNRGSAFEMTAFARQEADLADPAYSQHLRNWVKEAGLALGDYLQNKARNIPPLERFANASIQEDLSGAATSATVSPAVAARLKASATLAKQPPGFTASNEEVKAYWVERFEAAKVLADPQAIRESVPKVLGDEPDVAKREAFYADVRKAFEKAGAYGALTMVGDLYTDDKKIPLVKRVLVTARLASDWILIGDKAIAQRTLDKAKDMAKALKPDEFSAGEESVPLRLAMVEALLYSTFGDMSRSMQGQRTLQALLRQQYELADSDAARKRAAGLWSDNVWNLARQFVRSNRLDELQVLLNDAESARVASKIPQDRNVSALGAVAHALAAVGDYSKAMERLDTGVTLCEKRKVATTNNNCNVLRSLRSQIGVVLEGREATVQQDVDWIQSARAQDQIAAGNFSEKSLKYAEAMGKGQWEQARGIAADLLQSQIKRFGPEHAFAKEYASWLALAKARDPGYALSGKDVAEYAELFSGAGILPGAAQRGLALDRAAQEALLIAIAKGQGKLQGEDVMESAFQLMEYMRGTASQSALMDGAAKLAAADPKLRALIEKAQQLGDQRADRWEALGKLKDQLPSDPNRKPDDADKRQLDQVNEAKNRLNAQDKELQAVQAQIATQFPAYQELINPRIPGIKALAQQLATGQVYVSMYAGLQSGVVMAVASDGKTQIALVPVRRVAMESVVARYRKPFDASMVPQRVGGWEGFEAQAAHQLYKDWLAPIAESLSNASTLVIAPAGALSQVPWGAVLTEPAANVVSAKWAAARWAIVNTPGASSIVLQQHFRKARADKAFFAYADPQFAPQASAAAVGGVRGVRNLQIKASAATQAATAPAAPQPVESFDYALVPPLPDTLDEVRAAALAAGADPDKDTVTGAQARRSRVLTDKLDDRQIISFATHGLRVGELPGVTKPALAMAYEGRGLSDSLLDTDDIVSLKLKADWIVLSACNTGRVDGTTGESLSTMARAFFAAGAKALLATQWAVESASAKQLVVDALTAYGKEPSLTRAAALAQSQRAMASGVHGDLYRHPYFWAAYSTYGEPNR